MHCWLPANTSLINTPRLVKDAGTQIVSGSLGAERIARADTFCRVFFFRGLDPTPQALARCPEAVALSLAGGGFAWPTWDAF